MRKNLGFWKMQSRIILKVSLKQIISIYMYIKKEILSYVLEVVTDQKLKHEVHKFPSGSVIIDIWKGEEFFCIQIGNKSVGISKITEEEPSFTTIPDKSFSDFKLFKNEFESLIINPEFIN